MKKNVTKANALPESNATEKLLNNEMYVVGIGASAGGLDALQEFFDNIPQYTGIAFCVVQHLSPDFKSLMNELLGRHSKLEIVTASDGEIPKPNTIYLNPNHSGIIIENGKFKYSSKTIKEKGVVNLPIDMFLQSLALEFKEKSIGIILSGTGTDGSRGIKIIKEVGGTIMAQDPISAQFDGMPNTAIATGLVEYINNPANLALEVIKFPNKPSFYNQVNIGASPSDTESIFNKILDTIHKKNGIDFKSYKNNTLVRRLEKRMGILDITNINDYYNFIKIDKVESEKLMKDFFIGVTGFFRDKNAWYVIKEEVLPELFKNKPINEIVRVWVVGCSTGEEAYSMAILLDEYIHENNLNYDFKIFATDLDSRAIDIASKGEYIVNEITDISNERREKYFFRIGDRYEIIKKIREKIVFSTHNIIKNPPFIRIDLITCRNLLIYLIPKTQRRILNFFQFSLNQKGFLFLGNSESLNDLQKDFKIIDSKWRIYQCENKMTSLTSLRLEDEPNVIETIQNKNREVAKGLDKKSTNDVKYNDYLAKQYAPKGIFIDPDFNILFINGDLGKYLQIPQGIFQFNLLKMVSDPLSALIRNGVRKLDEEQKIIIFKNVQITAKKETSIIDISFSKVENSMNQIFVTIEEKNTKLAHAKVFTNFEIDKFSSIRISDLELDLKNRTEELQSLKEQFETGNEELQASNEELQASNEELQGTNEELQSVNEELYTVNSELQAKNKELVELYNDIDNIFASTEIGTLFLDNKLNIRKFTPSVIKHFHLESNDLGRSISNFTHQFSNKTEKEFIDAIKTVIENAVPIESEFIDHYNRIFLCRMLPFMGSNKQVNGAIITFVDITNLKKIEKSIEAKNNELLIMSQDLEMIIDNIPGLLYYKDISQNYIRVNANFAEYLQLDKKDIEGKNIFNLSTPDLAKQILEEEEEIFKSERPFTKLEFSNTEDGERWIRTSKVIIKNSYKNIKKILGISIDVTDLIELQNEKKKLLLQLQKNNQELSQFAYIASHDLQQPLNSLIGFTDLLNKRLKENKSEEIQNFLKIITQSAEKMKQLIKNILDYSRIGRNREFEMVSPEEIINDVINILKSADENFIGEIVCNKLPKKIIGNKLDLHLLFQNLIGNALKFNTSKNPTVTISAINEKEFTQFNISDNGIGIKKEHHEKIFEIFQRLHTESEFKGTGIGLAHCRKVVETHNGSIWVDSEYDKGSTFSFSISKKLTK